ncbi:hypothetical protein A0H76_2551 [Hepatospora eriocheir]|uniref:Uncharacterized protein n=1 Tax=Hepatospora eriocheir TaxID=1081669 RepID=A0A1X0QJS5_9MICR|nr:hypothetical protein A0H76_2551 [Hepatospora eriocheir]
MIKKDFNFNKTTDKGRQSNLSSSPIRKREKVIYNFPVKIEGMKEQPTIQLFKLEWEYKFEYME